MEKIAFTAHCSVAKEEDEAFIVGFADDDVEPRNYIILQRSVEQDREEVNGQLNSYFLEVNDQSTSGYGGIRNVLLSSERLSLELAPGNSYCGEIKEIHVALAECGVVVDEIADYLRRMFDNTDCKLTVA